MKSSSGYEIYHNTLSSCLNEVEEYIQSKGYQVGDYFPLINHVSYGQTERTQLEMIKNGKVANTLAIQIYRMESGRYELNCYPVRRFSGGGKILWAVKKGEPDWNEQIITEDPSQIEQAKKWAEQNGFDRMRIATINTDTPPDFKNTFKTGGYVRPPRDMKTSGTYLFRTNKGSFYVFSFLFEPENNTEDSLEIQDDLRGMLGSIRIKNSAWRRLASGKSVKAISNRGDYQGILTRVDDVQNSNKYVDATYNGYRNYENGGRTDDGIDLFEDYQNIPPQVQAILDNYSEEFESGDYKAMLNAVQDLEQIGYTFDFYVDGSAYDLRPVGTKGKASEEFATGGGVGSIKIGNKYLFKYDNKIWEVVGIEDHLIYIHNTQGLWWDNQKVTISLMKKWIKNKTMVKAMANGGGLETYKDLSKETAMVVNDSSPKLNKVPEIDLIRTGKVIESPSIRHSKDCYDIFKKFWDENNLDILEQLNVMFLSKANKPIGIYQHSKGGIDGTTMDIEIISAMAVKSLAKGVIVAHNHPSGALVPSEADRQMTNKLFNALKLFNISLLDSMIVTNNGYFSFADQGMMP